jgi:hypothetical protein
VISGQAYRAIEDNLKERGFVFDVELLMYLRLGGWPIREMPVAWREIPGSKLYLWKDVWSVLAGLMRIRKRLRRQKKGLGRMPKAL